MRRVGLFMGRMGCCADRHRRGGGGRGAVFRGDVANFVDSVSFNALTLSAAFVVTAVLLRLLGKRPRTAVLLAAVAGGCGLMVEWFLIGNSPWGNPDAVQIGMFAYWSCMVLVPVVLLDELTVPGCTATRRRQVLVCALGYTALALAAQLLPWPVPPSVYHLWPVVFGYLGLLLLCVVGLWRGSAAASPSGR